MLHWGMSLSSVVKADCSRMLSDSSDCVVEYECRCYWDDEYECEYERNCEREGKRRL
jgi:hypothetical protein